MWQNSLNNVFGKLLKVAIIKQKTLDQFYKYKAERDLFVLVKDIFQKNFESQNLFLDFLINSHSSHFQELLVANLVQYKKNGYYVEVGAADGIIGSNTYALEKILGWKGVLCEPAKIFHTDLRNNRPKSQICHELVWSANGDEVNFVETTIPTLSGVEIFQNSDKNTDYRISKKKYLLRSITLNQILKDYNAPKYIDYISIDCEGSELKILEGFNFERYSVEVFSIEHNFREDFYPIIELMERKGYEIKFNELTNTDYLFVKK